MDKFFNFQSIDSILPNCLALAFLKKDKPFLLSRKDRYLWELNEIIDYFNIKVKDVESNNELDYIASSAWEYNGDYTFGTMFGRNFSSNILYSLKRQFNIEKIDNTLMIQDLLGDKNYILDFYALIDYQIFPVYLTNELQYVLISEKNDLNEKLRQIEANLILKKLME